MSAYLNCQSARFSHISSIFSLHFRCSSLYTDFVTDLDFVVQFPNSGGACLGMPAAGYLKVQVG
jgi:hypothetical protein